MVTRTKTIESAAYIWPADTSQSIVCEGLITNQIVDDFGANVKIRVVTTTGYTDYGDKTEEYTDTYSKGYIRRLTASDDEVKEGIYQNGQILFVFKNTDITRIKTGNRIFYANEWYKITEVMPQVMGGTTYLIDATVEKYM